MKEIDLAEYGITNQYESLLADSRFLSYVGRILSQDKGMYRIITERGELLAEISGKFKYQVVSPVDYPAVGDFVRIESENFSGTVRIQEVLPRKSIFVRKAAGEKFQEQVVAVNIDMIFICMSLNRDFNIRRLERYLAVTWDSGAVPIIVLTKADLCEDTSGYLQEVSKVAFGVDVLITSSVEDNGYEQIRNYIKHGKTAAFIGSSGVGKSTMINRLLGEERLDTKGLRGDDKGRHTTTRRELFLLPQGGMVIDTPGMRELGMWQDTEGCSRLFSDIELLKEQCRFSDCTHTKEPGCAIRAAIIRGELSEERFNSYLKLKTENEYAEDMQGYLAIKKQKFKNIAKINKEAKRIRS